jgi:ribonuclease P protein component
MKSALKNKKKIETIFDKGFVVKAKGLLLKGYDFNDDETKFGVSVSKKSFPTAVKRNLIKRRIREQVKSLGFIGSVSKGLSFFIIYTSKEILSSKEIKKRIEGLARNL